MAIPVNSPNPPTVGGFSISRPRHRPRLVASIAGLDKSGKTHQGLDAPSPVTVTNLDTGLEGVVEKFQKLGKAVYSKDYRVVVPAGADPVVVATAANAQWEAVKSDLRAAWKHPAIRSTVVDTETDMWQLCRLARFGKLTQVMPHHYGPVNAEYAGFWNEVYDSDKNLILLGKLKEEWENDAQGKGKKTGKLERGGFKDINYIVQVNCIARFEPGQGFSLEIVNCRQNPDAAGLILGPTGNPDAPFQVSFKQLGLLVYPDSSEADWV